MNGLLWPQSNHPGPGNVVALLGSPRARCDPHFPSVWLPSFTARVWCHFRLAIFQSCLTWFVPTSLLSTITLNFPPPPPATVTLLWRFHPGTGVGIWQGKWREGWGLIIWVLSGRWIRYRCLAVVKERVSLLHAYIISHLHCLKTLPPPKSISWFPVRLPRPKKLGSLLCFVYNEGGNIVLAG